VKTSRRCEEKGFKNLSKPMKVAPLGDSYDFCPGKATWYPEIAELFQSCRVALETGILPKAGSLEDQDESFAEVFPLFIEKWKDATYRMIWSDVSEFTEKVLTSIFGKKKG